MHFAAGVDGQHGHVGSQRARVAQELEALRGQVGQQAYLHGLLDVDELPEGATDQELLDVGDVDADATAEY